MNVKLFPFFIQTIFDVLMMYCEKGLYNEAKRKVQYGLTGTTAYDRLRNINYYLAIFLFVTFVVINQVFYGGTIHSYSSEDGCEP